jgi:hypothetical protein
MARILLGREMPLGQLAVATVHARKRYLPLGAAGATSTVHTLAEPGNALVVTDRIHPRTRG